MELFKSINITTKINRPKEELNVGDFLLKSSIEIKRYNLDIGSYMLLENQKSKIDHIHKNIWLNISFLSNPYEYIHPKITKYYKNDRVVLMDKPISRAFYKMWEIMNVFPILKNKINERNILYNTEKPYLDSIKTAHLCEGPGGFIEALIKKRGHFNDEIHGLTIMCENKNKLFNNILLPEGEPYSPHQQKNDSLRESSEPLYPHTKTEPDSIIDYINIQYGDITNVNTIQKFSEQFEDVKAYIVTADGGFEDEHREDIQEQIHSQLIFSEILTALKIQAKNGRFICKIYDINTKLTAFMIKLLTYFYKDVYVFKPTASRPINSERYLVCLDFIGISDVILNKLIEIKKIWTEIDKSGGQDNKLNQKYIYSMYNDRKFDYEDISRFNFLYTNQQLKYINFALGSISNIHETFFLDKIKQSQIEYSIEWCIDNNIPIHDKYKKIHKDNNQIDYKSIINAIDNNDEEYLSLIRINKGKIQLFIYTYLKKKYHLLSYFIKNIRLSNLLYHLNSTQIYDLLKNISIEDRSRIVLPITKICLLYINKPENSILKDYFCTLYMKDIHQSILKTPLNRLKYFIKYEKIHILKELSKNYHLSIKIMKYSLYYNTSFSFIRELHLLNSHYNFTEEDLIRTIKYGNFEMFEYICQHILPGVRRTHGKNNSLSEAQRSILPKAESSEPPSFLEKSSGTILLTNGEPNFPDAQEKSLKLYSKYIFNYAIKYDFPIDIIKKIINLYGISPNYNIYKLMKRDIEEIKDIFDLFNKKKFNHPNIKIYHFINDNYKTPIHLLLILYKYKVLHWSIQDLNFLKNKLPEKEMESLLKLISHHLYDDKLDL